MVIVSTARPTRPGKYHCTGLIECTCRLHEIPDTEHPRLLPVQGTQIHWEVDMRQLQRKHFPAIGSLVASFLLAGATLVVPSASAATKHELDSYTALPWSDPPAHIEFEPHGDVSRVCDGNADGRKAYLAVTEGSYEDYHLLIGGEGRCRAVGADDGGKYNLKEGRVYTFYACAWDVDVQHESECETANWRA